MFEDVERFVAWIPQLHLQKFTLFCCTRPATVSRAFFAALIILLHLQKSGHVSRHRSFCCLDLSTALAKIRLVLLHSSGNCFNDVDRFIARIFPLHLQKFVQFREHLDVKLALERWCQRPWNIKLALEGRFRAPCDVKLALERWFRGSWDVKLALERRVREPVDSLSLIHI